VESSDWKIKASALDNIEKTIESNIDSLKPFLSSFAKYFLKYLTDNSFKVAYTTMLLYRHILGCPDLPLKIDVGILIPPFVDKLGDNKIAIRQIA